MINSILVPLDTSELAHRVLPHAHNLAQAFDANATLLHVLEWEHKTGDDQVDPISWQFRKVEAQCYLNEAAQSWEAQSAPLETALLEGPAADRIIDYSEEHSIDLVVLSTHGRSGLARWSLSSVTQKVIHLTSNSFFLVRAYRPSESQNIRYRRIMVPLDGSIRAEVALPIAARLAMAQESELLLVHAVAQPHVIERQPLAQKERQLTERLTSWNEARAERYLTMLKSRLTYEAESRLLGGRNDSDSLLDFIEDEDIDLVVASAHGFSGERVRPFGSVVTNLITYGSAHLLVVQDFEHGEIRQTRAAVAARDQATGGQLMSSRLERLALRNPA